MIVGLDKLDLLRWFGQANLLFYLCAFVIVASLTLGGGARNGRLSEAILQLVAIPLLLVALWKLFEVPLTKQMRVALLFCFAIADPSARSIDSTAAVALDGVAEQTTVSGGV